MVLDAASTLTVPTVNLLGGGTLSANGTLNSSVNVGRGAALMGTGTVGTTTVANGGTLAPGNSIGTLNVAGNTSFAAGSTYRVEVDATGASDRLAATGTATLNGGTVAVLAAPGAYQPSTSYTILTAAGGITGAFARVTSNLAFLAPSLVYGANNVLLDADPQRGRLRHHRRHFEPALDGHRRPGARRRQCDLRRNADARRCERPRCLRSAVGRGPCLDQRHASR